MKPYFSHDEGARNDPKLVAVLMEMGHEGKSVYWDLVEMLYEQGGYLELAQCRRYAFALHTNCDLILKLVNEFGLFAADGEKFWSETALERMKMRDAKKQARAEAGAKGGKVKAEKEAAAKALLQQKPSNAIANPGNAIATKVKEIKVNTSNDVAPSPEALKAETIKLRAALTTDPEDEQHWSTGPLTKPGPFKVIAERLGFLEIDFEHYRKQALVAAEDANTSRTINQWTSWIRNFFNNQQKHGPLLKVSSIDLTKPTPRNQYPAVGKEFAGQVFVLENTGDDVMNRHKIAATLKYYPTAAIHFTQIR